MSGLGVLAGAAGGAEGLVVLEAGLGFRDLYHEYQA